MFILQPFSCESVDTGLSANISNATQITQLETNNNKFSEPEEIPCIPPPNKNTSKVTPVSSRSSSSASLTHNGGPIKKEGMLENCVIPPYSTVVKENSQDPGHSAPSVVTESDVDSITPYSQLAVNSNGKTIQEREKMKTPDTVTKNSLCVDLRAAENVDTYVRHGDGEFKHNNDAKPVGTNMNGYITQDQAQSLPASRDNSGPNSHVDRGGEHLNNSQFLAVSRQSSDNSASSDLLTGTSKSSPHRDSGYNTTSDGGTSPCPNGSLPVYTTGTQPGAAYITEAHLQTKV